MLKTQVNQYDMLLAVENHFEDSPTIWSSNVPVSDAKTALSDKISELAIQVALQMRKSTGITQDKVALRKDLEEQGFVLSAALSGFAATTPGKKDIYKNVHIFKSDFAKFRESELIGVITNLNAEAQLVMENLEIYGVTQATLTDLLAANDAFRTIMHEPEETISGRKHATDAIPVLLHQAIAILDDQMDNLIEMLRAAQPLFVDVYFNERHIHNTGHHTLSLTIMTLDAGTDTPLEKVDITIVGEGIKRVSGSRGYNKVQNLTQGSHQLSVSRPGYASQVIPFIVISGETTQLVIEMQGMVEEVSK